LFNDFGAMMIVTQPLVTVVTPVYNGAKYLEACIESVLRQDYKNWEYIIVNNCSTDSTLDIASHYAGMDSRIRVVTNSRFVDVIENHNIAFGHISKDSKYCKVVSADDWIYPDCIGRMVQVAEDHPSVAIVGCYAVSSVGVWYAGLPPERSVFTGKEVCRLHLLGGLLIMGAPTSILYRSDIVRAEKKFFPGSAQSADISACFRSLQHHDFGFVHQVLAYLRIHDEALSDEQGHLRAYPLDRIAFVRDYGNSFLTREEYDRRLNELLDHYYYDVLASAFVKRYPKKFWSYHKGRLEEIGLPYDRGRYVRAVIRKMIDLACNPKQTIEKARRHRSAD
jgi:glycosyltransferase involved in cell wall biosynthesis